MLRKRLRARLVLAVIAATQALAPGVASIADARPEAFAVSRRIAPHVEKFGAKHSWRVHLDNCALNQIAGRHAPPPNTAPLLCTRVATPQAAFAAYGTVTLAGHWAAPNSRAPPAV
jgi:hypothetical protein